MYVKTEMMFTPFSLKLICSVQFNNNGHTSDKVVMILKFILFYGFLWFFLWFNKIYTITISL